MQFLYLLLILLTPLGPIALSFDKRVAYVKTWKWSLLAVLIIAIPYLLWDQYFTQNEVWGFNPEYLSGVYLGDLPIEEVSFFFVVPFACTFIYACVKYYFRNVNLKVFNYVFVVLILGYVGFLYSKNMIGWYTISAILVALPVILYIFRDKQRFQYLPLAFVFSLLPFFLINGILTGSFIEGEIVWYNPDHFSGIRLFTIPMEDVIYGFGLIALNIILYERFSKPKTQEVS